MTTSPANTTSFNNALQKSIQYTNSKPIVAPASPEPYSSDFGGFNSDDLVPTSALDVPDDEKKQQQQQQSLVIVGSTQHRITLGRGGSSTVKIGRRNRQISRTHVAIEYAHGRFELVVLGLNGATVDRILYRQHERAPLDDYSFVDVLGDTLIFRLPPLPTLEAKDEHVVDRDIKTVVEQVSPSSPPSVEDNDSESSQHNNNDAPSPPVIDDMPSQLQTLEPTSEQVPVMHDDRSDKESQDQCSDKEDLKDQPTQDEHSDKENKPIQDEHNDKENKPIQDEHSDKENKPLHDEHNDKENQRIPQDSSEDTTDYAENIIDILVFSKKSSMPISDICSRIMKTNPSYKTQDRTMWTRRIERVLKEKAFFGEIVRKGKTADGSPKENLYYYNSVMDPVEWRRATYTQVGRSARKCTLQDKQYFWRIPPKLGKNRHAYIPPPLQQQEKRPLESLDNDDGVAKKQKQ